MKIKEKLLLDYRGLYEHGAVNIVVFGDLKAPLRGKIEVFRVIDRPVICEKQRAKSGQLHNCQGDRQVFCGSNIGFFFAQFFEHEPGNIN